MATDLATTDDLEPLATKEYSPDEILHMLTVLALNGGQCRRTARVLKEQGIDVTHQALSIWRRERYPNRYAHISAELAPKIEAQVINLQREIALNAANGTLEAVDLERDLINNGEVKDAGASAKNLATVAGIAVDKVLSLTGRPTSITEHRTADQSINRLASLGLVDSTAVEIPNDESEADPPSSLLLPAAS